MKPVLLIDFGSTFTKATAADLDAEAVLGTAQSFTTVNSDIGEGLENALAILREKTGIRDFPERYACSSAAGGLRMIACGLVPELTAEAARLASLGAGAKVIKTYSYRLTDGDASEIDELDPDIVLLTGGTDGGDSAVILGNAAKLAACKKPFPVVLAGNRSCRDECAALLEGREISPVENVMPALGEINIEPAQEKIREIFLRRIILAKGLSRAEKLISGIMLPTPAAMLEAMKLLARGSGGEPGLGELIAVDLGGATTDVYSLADGAPELPNTFVKGIPEPFAKRTVEGDIGMRYSAGGTLRAAGPGRLAALSGLGEELVAGLIDQILRDPSALPSSPELKSLDFALAAAAVSIALERHAGTIRQVFTPAGEAFMQTGKDLRRVGKIVATGGALIHTERPDGILAAALQNRSPESLRPVSAVLLTDRRYILSAMGLLGQKYPETALRIMKKELINHGA